MNRNDICNATATAVADPLDKPIADNLEETMALLMRTSTILNDIYNNLIGRDSKLDCEMPVIDSMNNQVKQNRILCELNQATAVSIKEVLFGEKG